MKPILRACSALLGLIFVASAADYFPLAVGNEWNYSISNSGFTGTARLAIDQKTVRGTDTLFRIFTKVAVEGMDDSNSGYMMSNGNDVFSVESLSVAKPYDKGFEHQPVAGHTWNSSLGETRKIVFYGSITLAAGTFNSCYALVVEGDTSEIYAPDVGMVANLVEGEITLALASYTVLPPSPVVTPSRQVLRTLLDPTTGVYSNLYSLVNAQGRCVDKCSNGKNGKLDQTLSPGKYFLFDKNAHASGTKGATTMCVTGR